MTETASRPSVRVRDARPADVDRIREIYAHHVLHGLSSFEEVPPDLAEMRRRFEGAVGQGLPYLAADMTWPDGRTEMAGYAYAGRYRPRPAYRYTVENSVYVDPDCLGGGVGRALVVELIARCTALGFRQMIAVIGDSGNEASIRFHEALGFARVGLVTSVGFKFGRWVDSVIMQRPLGRGDSELPPRSPNG